jgi:hypothetical protein
MASTINAAYAAEKGTSPGIARWHGATITAHHSDAITAVGGVMRRWSANGINGMHMPSRASTATDAGKQGMGKDHA